MTTPNGYGQSDRGQPSLVTRDAVVPPQAVPSAGGVAGHVQEAAPDTMLAIAQIERYVRMRRDTDQPLISWGLCFFLLSWLTLGVYPVVIFYKRLNRADLFSDRRQHYYGAVLDFTTRYADQTGQAADVHYEAGDLAAYVKERFASVHRPIKAGLSVLLSFVTLGVYGFISIYRLMKYWWEIQVTEQDFCEKLSLIWTKLGIIHYPISYEPVQQVRRSFWMSFLLSIITVGIYGIFWDYHLHTDPDKVYPEMHSTEDAVLSAARTAHGAA
jgi:hypothetical protein